MMPPLLRAVRPRQWVKNLFVGAPLIFGKSLLDGHQAVRAAAAVAIFCIISSAVYLWNDIVDVESDRAHPRKRTRPIAAGELSLQSAKSFAAAFAALGLSLAYLLDPAVAAVAATYLGLNVGYSVWLKHVPYVDVLVIAAGFLLRVWAGSLATEIHPSPWLLLCTGLLASFLGFGKRTHELASSGEQTRQVLAAYHPGILRVALYLTGAATVAAYFLYTLSEHTREYFHTTRMVLTVPAIAVGVGRFLMLTSTRPDAESPTEEILRDPLFIANLAVWCASVIAIIYLAR